MLTPVLNPEPGVTFPDDDDGQTTVTAWVDNDGADDTPEWARGAVHVQIDTDDSFRGVVVHLNDGPRIYQGNPDVHDSAAEVLRKVRDLLAQTAEPELDVPVALDMIKRSGVIL